MVGTSPKTFKACRACRQKRARCDGETPCERCTRLSIACVYDARPGETKEKLRDERTQLEAHEAAAAVIIKALATRKDDEEALIAIWRREPIEDIAAKLLEQQAEIEKSQPDNAVNDVDADADTSLSGRASTKREHPSELDDIHESEFAHEDEYPEQHQTTGQEANKRTNTRSFGSRRGSGPGAGLPQRTSTRSQSTFADTSPQSAFSPTLSRSERSAYETPTSISQSPFRPPSNAPAKSSSAGMRHDLTGEQWEQAGLMRMPYELTRSLIETFFQKQYSLFPMVRRDLFFENFMTGKKEYCSSALVRMLCCFGSRIAGGYDAAGSYYAGLANHLFDEAMQVLKSPEGSVCNIPNTHALGLMSLHQLAVGDNERAQELAEEGVRRLGLMHRQASPQEAVATTLQQSMQAITLVGAISLARMVRLSVAHVFCPRPTSHLDGSPMVMFRQTDAKTDPHVEQLMYLPYLQIRYHREDLTQLPSAIFQLTDWIYGFVSRSQVTEGNVLPKLLRDTYRACLSWYSSMLASLDEGTSPEPFIHLFYHFCLLTLFRPYCCVESEDVSPTKICSESADAILTLTKACRQLESPQLMCFVPLFIQAAAHAELDILTRGEEAVGGGIESWVAGIARARGGSNASAVSTGSSLSEMAGDEETARRSLTDRALEQLVELSTVYPSARKAVSVLRGLKREVSGWKLPRDL